MNNKLARSMTGAILLAGSGCSSVPDTKVSPFPSCRELATSCAGSDPDCCASNPVEGGTFQRDNVLDEAVFAATIGDFRLDTYEVTVGRFARYLAAYPGSKPAAGSGKNPRNAADTGWDPAWDQFLPADQAALKAAVLCDQDLYTWGAGDDLAMNCVTWFDANAFCIWDGGRLPTSAEWDYVAAGGKDQRPFPWSHSPSDETIDGSYAVYSFHPGDSPVTHDYVAPVGSKSPKGDGKYGQSDLAGNVWEWVQDWYVPYPTSTCNNCATLVAPPNTTDRVTRGGSTYDDATYLKADIVDVRDPTSRIYYIGLRCARDR